MNIIVRPLYSEKIKPYIGKGLIKILTGQRRVGKSYIMRQLMDELQKPARKANIIYINKEDFEFRSINDAKSLNDYIQPRLKTSKRNYLFIDEIQEIKNFELVLRSLQSKEACDIFCSGSNAQMLSGELATHLAGRYIEFHIHSLSYGEFLEFHKLKDSDSSLMLYLTYGGLPYLAHLTLNETFATEYLKNIYSTILLKDIVAREGIRNVSFLEDLSEYIADNVGSLFSATSISKYLKAQKRDTAPSVILNYLRGMCNAFILNKVERYDIQGKKRFETNEKYYFEDLGLRNALVGFQQERDIAKLLENAVYLHLHLSGYEIHVGQIPNGEIDFVAEKNGKRLYLQVAYLIPDQAAITREFGNLAQIQDNYPKYVISMNPLNKANDYNGIKHLHIRKFLLMDL